MVKDAGTSFSTINKKSTQEVNRLQSDETLIRNQDININQPITSPPCIEIKEGAAIRIQSREKTNDSFGPNIDQIIDEATMGDGSIDENDKLRG